MTARKKTPAGRDEEQPENELAEMHPAHKTAHTFEWAMNVCSFQLE